MDPSPKKETEMNAETMKSALAAALTCLSSAALAVIQTLPMPPPSPYPDAESSVAVPLDASCGPLMRLRIAADFTPSNAVIVAFGTDVDNDGDLSPEETAIRVGVDCGIPFVRKEVVVGSPSPTMESSNLPCTPTPTPTTYTSPTPNIYAFVLKQPSDVSRRYDLAKVTTHNLTSTSPVVTVSRVGTMIFVR